MKTICIMCPMGCELEIRSEDGRVIVEGNTCKRGADYGEAEFTRPVRTLTTLVRRADGEVVSVKTTRPVPKESLNDVLSGIKAMVAPDDAKIGDVLAADFMGLGTDIVVTGTPDR